MKDDLSDEDKKMYGSMEGKWQAESDLRTLTEAEAIKKDKARFKKAMHCGRKQKESIEKLMNK